MKHTMVLFLTVAAFLCCLPFSAQAAVVFYDDFDSGSLNQNDWRILPQNASGIDYTVSGSKLVVEDIMNPTVINNAGGGTWAIVTLFSKNFDRTLDDFSIDFQCIWSSDDPQTGDQSPKAMQGLYMQAYDADAAQIARVGYQDAWVGSRGGIAATMPGGNAKAARQNELDFSGSATITISRSGGAVAVKWDGETLLSGTNSKPLQSIGILFYYYAYDGTGGPSFFGTESVELVRVSDEPPDDVTTSSSTSSTTTSCPDDKPAECGNGTCCASLDRCCGTTCCEENEQCCGEICCDESEYYCCYGGCCFEEYECELIGEQGYCMPPYAECMITSLGEDSGNIALLRKYRDEVLSKSPLGQEIISFYYLWSPFIVRAMEEDEEFKQEVRELIEQLLPMIEATMQ